VTLFTKKFYHEACKIFRDDKQSLSPPLSY
jgi:hypothetical protein